MRNELPSEQFAEIQGSNLVGTPIGSINDFYTRPIPRLGISSLRMSDGPTGVHDYGPTTAFLPRTLAIC